MVTQNQSSEALHAIIAMHLRHYPALRLDDLYKLVYQGAMGSEHAVADIDQVYRRLNDERRVMTSQPDGPLGIAVSPDRRLVRVHLGPFLDNGGDLQDLAQACVETAGIVKPSTDRMARYWSWVEGMATQQLLPFSIADVKRYGDRRRSQSYPAVHHSPYYRRMYHPAYRVVLTQLIDFATE